MESIRQKGRIDCSSKSVEEIREIIGADSLNFLSVEGMVEAIGRPFPWRNGGTCLACFTGNYPTEIYESNEKKQNVNQVGNDD